MQLLLLSLIISVTLAELPGDLEAVSDEVHAEAMRAAELVHQACLQTKRRRAARGAEGEQEQRELVTAFFHAQDAAAKVIRRAYPRPKAASLHGAASGGAHSDEDEGEDSAQIERERRHNMARNHEVLVSLGLA